MHRVDKEGMLFSSIVHLGAILVMLLVSFLASAFKTLPPPHIFEMVEMPEGALTEAIPQDVPEVKAIEIKLPEWEDPEPQPVKPKPQVVEPPKQKPKPKPVEQKPEPKPEKLKQVSWEEYVRLQGERPEPKQSKPRTPPPTPPKVDVSKIEQQIRKTVMSAPTLSLSQTSPMAESSAERVWKSQLAAALDRLWKQVRSELASGTRVRISFTVSPGGRLGNIRVLRSSGNRSFDQLGVNTLHKLGSFSPPPDRKAQNLTIEFALD